MQALADFPQINAASCLMIGDSKSDIEFGMRLGIRTVLICGNSGGIEAGQGEAKRLADFCYPSLLEAVCNLIGESAESY